MKLFKKKFNSNINVGDKIKVGIEIIENKKIRIQSFEGIIISFRKKNTMIIRNRSYGVNIERMFLINSPKIKYIDYIHSFKIRKAKLFYLRSKINHI